MDRGDGPFKVLSKVGANAYKLELPGDMVVSATFNVGDLGPYVKDEIDFGDLRYCSFRPAIATTTDGPWDPCLRVLLFFFFLRGHDHWGCPR